MSRTNGFTPRIAAWPDQAGAGDALPPLPAGPAADAYLATDFSGVIEEANRAAVILLQCPREFLIGKPLGLFVTAGSRPTFYRFLIGRKQAGPGTACETRLGCGNRAARDVILWAEVLIGEEGRPAGLRWVMRDVTPTRRIEQALRAERELLNSVIGAAQAIILVLDAEGRVLRSNAYLHEVFGYPAKSLEGRCWDEVLLQPDDRPAARAMMREARTDGVARGGVLPLLTRGGERREVAWSARGLPEEVAGAMVLIGHDVTELEEAQRQALRAERLAAIGQMAAGLAHDSRNALQRIQACLSLLALRLRDRPDALDLIDRGQRAQDDLHHLFEDVLAYAAALKLTRSPCELSAVWRAAWADLAVLPGQETSELIEDSDGTDPVCEADPHQLKRLFRNLFENARAAAPCPVRVVVRCWPAPLGSRPALEVSVRDNGPGFPSGQRRRLFEPFFTTKTRGTGLGLAICRRIVEAHGGRIEAGPDGPGAEILITLPLRTL